MTSLVIKNYSVDLFAERKIIIFTLHPFALNSFTMSVEKVTLKICILLIYKHENFGDKNVQLC